MYLLRGLRRDQAVQRLPELRGRLRAAADPTREGVAAGRVRCEAGAIRQAGASELQPRGRRGALRASEGREAGGAVAINFVIARSDLSAVARRAKVGSDE